MNDGLKLNSKGPEFLLYLVHHLASVLQEGGLTAESAKDMAIASAVRMAEQCGGQSIYFPKRTLCFKLEERDWNIYREYNGTNRNEVCAKYGIARSRLYQIISAIRRQRSTQPLNSKNTAIGC
jgi:Mor family transcriptional regulator